jgi:flagellar M-ring protein FliF
MFESLKRYWNDANRASRAGFVVGLFVIVAGLVIGIAMVLRSDYATLFSDLNPQDAATIVAELDRMKVPYRLGPDESSIQVDRSIVHSTRLKLMGRGVNLHGGVGLEIFANNDFGMTEFAQKVNYQRAMQGELERTISALDEVRSVRVHLVLPESGLFRQSTVRPKAAITLAMKPGRHVQAQQVQGIQRLVAAAVAGIEPNAVTILDEHGLTLTRPADPEGEQGSEARFSAKSEIEQYFARKVVAVLDKTFGPGRAIVSIDVTLDHDQVKVTREDVIPAGGRGEAGGALTRKRTTTTGSGAATGADGARGSSSTSEVEYQHGRRVEQVIQLPGSVRRLSVGVMLPHAIGAERLAELRRVVAMSVGLNESRGDEIAISSLDQFGTPATTAASVAESHPRPTAAKPAAAPAPTNSANLRSLWPWGAGLLVLIVGLLIVAVALEARSRRGERPQLSREERERLLARVRDWIAGDESLAREHKA